MVDGDDTHSGTVFIVDDDAAVRDSLSVLLEAHGLGVYAYDSIAAFTRNYRPRACACLVLDHHMPAVTGLEFLSSKEGHDMTIPAILITGGSDDDIRAQAKEAGVFAFLAKPLAGNELMSAIRNALAHNCTCRAGDLKETDYD